MSQQDLDHQALSASCQQLEQSRKTLLLSTLNTDQFPEISYAPYFKSETGEFFIFISELSAHTQNLLANPKASVMFIADECDSQNLFARERLIYQCHVEEIERGIPVYTERLDQLETKFGNIMGMLRTLTDFKLFQLKPVKGTYVVGFGKAYEVEPKTGQLVHISADKLSGKS